MKKILMLSLFGFVSLQAGQSVSLEGLVDFPTLASAGLGALRSENTPSFTNRFDLLQQGIKYGLNHFTTADEASNKLSTLLGLVGLDDPESIFYYGDALIDQSVLNNNISSINGYIKAFTDLLFDENGNKAFQSSDYALRYYALSDNSVVQDITTICRLLANSDSNSEVANVYKEALYTMYEQLKQLLLKMQASKEVIDQANLEAKQANIQANLKKPLDLISDESKTVTVVDRAVGGIKNAANSLYSYFWSSKSNTSQPIAAPQADDDAEETKADTADSQANLATSADSGAVSSEASVESDSQSAPAVVANEEYTDLEYTDL